MPVDAALIAARLGKPGDLRHPVTDRDQKHRTVSAATQANTRDLAKWHVDHAAHSQPVFLRLTVSSHGEGSLLTRRTYNHSLMFSATSIEGLIDQDANAACRGRDIARATAAGCRPRGSPWSSAPSLPSSAWPYLPACRPRG